MKKLTQVLLLSAILLTSLDSLAGVQIGGTRVIYDEKEKEVSVQLRNPDNKAFLVQSWTESESGTPDKTFAVTPPLFRLDAKENNALRILFRGASLPADRETLFWLNVKAIPSGSQSGETNQLQLAVKTRIKLIYRPASMAKSSPTEVADQLKWSQSGNTLTVKNNTAYYMNFSSVVVNGTELQNVTYVAPNSSKSFLMNTKQAGGKVDWKVFNDYGVPSQTYSGSF